MASKAPQRRRGYARVATLLDAASSVFAGVGYDAATMTAVAVRASAPIGSLYQFFPTKALLAEALYRREMERLSETLAISVQEVQFPPQSLDAVADRLFVALVDFCAVYPALAIVAERQRIHTVHPSKVMPGMCEQLTELLRRTEPRLAPQQVQHAAILLLRMMKAAVSVQTNQDPGAETLIADIRAMLRWRLSSGRELARPRTAVP